MGFSLKLMIRPALALVGWFLEHADKNDTGIDDLAAGAIKNLATSPDLDGIVDKVSDSRVLDKASPNINVRIHGLE